MSNTLRERRKELGLSIRDLAARVGMSPGHLSDIETGKQNPSFTMLQRLVTNLANNSKSRV